MSLLNVRHLNVNLKQAGEDVKVLMDINFSIAPGERIAIVGESGAGKSMLASAITQLLVKPSYIESGSVTLRGKELTKLSDRQWLDIRGQRIAMIFQDPMMTLNPVLTIGAQMVEAIRSHTRITYRDARKMAVDKLAQVHIASPRQRFDQYPHELSGGMRQRVIIAIVLLLRPELIIADEPTTSLDVTIQAEILQLLKDICERDGVALLFISHDFGVVARISERTLVMYAGKIVEQGGTLEIINDPQHPYTQGLLNALPQMALPGERLNQIMGNMPSPAERPMGCAFHPRCRYATPLCKQKEPSFINTDVSIAACFLLEELISQEENADD